MPFKKGDFLLIDYIGKVVETGETFDTTIEEVAKTEGIYKDGATYENILVVVGEGWLLKALDDRLLDLKLRKTSKIEISAEDGFGERDPDKIKLYPLRKLTGDGSRLNVGMRVEIEGRLATIRTIGSGRVLLDFNPPLAGRTLIYEVTIQKKLRLVRDKIKALVHRRIPQADIEKFSFNIGKTSISINIPEEVFYLEGLQLVKRGIFVDIQKFFPRKNSLTFTETFKKIVPVSESHSSVADQ